MLAAKMFSSWSTSSSRLARSRRRVLVPRHLIGLNPRKRAEHGRACGRPLRRPVSPPCASNSHSDSPVQPSSASSGSAEPKPAGLVVLYQQRLGEREERDPDRRRYERSPCATGRPPAPTPGAVNRGANPARISDDFPAPLSPTMSRNGTLRGAEANGVLRLGDAL